MNWAFSYFIIVNYALLQHCFLSPQLALGFSVDIPCALQTQFPGLQFVQAVSD
jgi:hypothetical protein